MNTVVAALVGLVVVYAALRWFVNANPAAMAAGSRFSMFLAGLAIAGILIMTGRVGFGLPLAVVLLYLYGKGVFRLPARPAPRKSGQRAKSMVRSAALEMELDHATGKMTGRVLAGSFEGRDLDTLDAPALGRLAGEIASDPESRALLEAYLDRRMPRWREHVKADAAAGHRGPPNAGAMSEEEAYQILGLQKGAGEPEIRAAHRRLMKKVHPDYGGSTFLAARINQAKDRLLSKHR